jgi:hypothetical protein
MPANQLRMWFSAMAYVLVDSLRRIGLRHTQFADAAGATIRLATLLLSSQLLAQFSQQGPKLVGTGAVGAAEQGSAVALSATGNTAIVGGFEDNSRVGAAWVYTRSGGVWTQQGNKLVANDAGGAALQGYSVALSSDGNTAIVGGPFDNGWGCVGLHTQQRRLVPTRQQAGRQRRSWKLSSAGQLRCAIGRWQHGHRRWAG